ncbi:MCE family protein [Saccharomonospora glauca]|jgi:phospholipid/cholesterol/gamma-HCH transport system substrate-binding protein|uniref:Virulence factor Mce family protein n=1 Tax=Saccharomonospora glauca K62 TaxID=928724 RepID=I1CXH0_9PSEU|nr:MCE family protein [Saccharomonospora glauca]EIE97394.1 virulence factor Mce family protein [Saccharomonospora glauca K62]
MRRLRTALAAASAATLLVIGGCGFSGAHDIPLPGGADLGDDPYTVRIHFRDVLDLVPQAGVRVGEVPVGTVEEIKLADDGWTAEVVVSVNRDVELPAGAIANLRQSSLLGEKYVELAAPPESTDTPAAGRLSDGDLIPVERTNRSVEVEEVLGALSMLLNGGGVEQLNTITRELGAALKGNSPDVKALLRNAEELVRALDEQSSDITSALDSLNRLSSTLSTQRDKIAVAVEDLSPGLEVLERQRGQLVDMLSALDNLSEVAVETVNASQEDLVANLEALLPTLRKLAEAGADLPNALELLLTYPFTDAAAEGVKGDYMNLYLELDLNLKEILANLGRSRQNPLQNLPIVGDLTNPRETDPEDTSSLLPLPGDEDYTEGGDGGAGLGGLIDEIVGGDR